MLIDLNNNEISVLEEMVLRSRPYDELSEQQKIYVDGVLEKIAEDKESPAFIALRYIRDTKSKYGIKVQATTVNHAISGTDVFHLPEDAAADDAFKVDCVKFVPVKMKVQESEIDLLVDKLKQTAERMRTSNNLDHVMTDISNIYEEYRKVVE